MEDVELPAIRTQVREIVAGIVEKEPAEIGFEDSLPEVHDVNSLMGLEILVSLDKRFQIKIPQSAMQTMVTISAISDLILALKTGSGHPSLTPLPEPAE
jgi:acyl carrier protein